jgi:hypothetical protein
VPRARLEAQRLGASPVSPLRRLFLPFLVLFVLPGPEPEAAAQVGVAAPGAGSAEVSGTSDSPSLLGSHTWTLTADEAEGASLVISAPSFTHGTQTSKKAAIRLNLVKTSGSAWSVGAGDSTSSGESPAQVTAASSGPGGATFSVDVRFVPGDVSVLPSGVYETTITGTITANP